MALTTFGAIMGFAAEMARRSVDLYKTAIENVKDSNLMENLKSLLEEEKKNHSLMEQARRENVTEMILEPVAGLTREDYEMDPEIPKTSGDSDLLEAALRMERNEHRFFQDASEKIPLPEVSRMFKKIARKKEGNIDRLQSLRFDP